MSALLANQAIDLSIAALVMAFATLITSIAGYVQVRTKQATQAAHIADLQKQADKPGAGGSPTTVVTIPPGPGSGTLPLNAPAWNQLNDPLPDAQQDPYATTDCGEESVAMAIAACGGPALPAGVLRQILGGSQRRGSTTGVDLSYLLTLFKVQNHVRDADPDSAWVEWQHSFQAGYLAIALGYWVSPGFRHWVLLRECDAAGVTFNDPWGGAVRRLGKADAQKLYNGVYVHLDQAVTDMAPLPPVD